MFNFSNNFEAVIEILAKTTEGLSFNSTHYTSACITFSISGNSTTG